MAYFETYIISNVLKLFNLTNLINQFNLAIKTITYTISI